MAKASLDTASVPNTDIAAPSKLEIFFDLHFKKILLVLCLVGLAFAAYGVSRYLHNQTEKEAGTSFTSAKTIEDYDIVIQKFPGTTAAGNALLSKAQLLWKEGKKESSVSTLQEFLKQSGAELLRPHALLALGSKQGSLGDKDAARQSLDKVIKEHGESEIAPAAQIQLADLLWSEGKIDEAKKIFEEMPRTYPGKMAAFTMEVDERVKLMNAGLPNKEVEAPPAPVVPAPAPATPAPAPATPAPAPATPAPAPATPAPAPATPAPAPATPAPAPATPAPAPAPATPAPAPATPAPAPAPVTPAPAPVTPTPAAQ